MRYIRVLLSSLFIVLGVCSSALALEVPAKPSLERPIVDTTNTLTASQQDALAALINRTRQEKSYQIGVLMIPSLENRALEDYSIEVARTWGIGDKSNNGVLLLVVKNDRLMRIEVGSGLEGDLTDAESGRIIRNVIAPEFRLGNYHEGIRKAVLSIKAQVEKTADPNGATAEAAQPGWADVFFPLVFFGSLFISWFGSLLARSRSWWAGGIIGAGVGVVVAVFLSWTLLAVGIIALLTVLGLLFDYFVSKNFYYKSAAGDTPSWWAGGTWIDSGSGWGGSGGSFGGGGFSGGGSSGSW